MPAWHRLFAIIALACAFGGVACAPEIGDSCDNALDCSASGSRLCDRTQPAGYCTISGCEQGTCPEEAVCVQFRPQVERLSQSYCMRECSEDSDCRDGRGYLCLRADEFGNGSEARLLATRKPDKRRFCALPAEAPSDGDAGVSGTVDASASGTTN